jgi:uncharacterized protein (DUF58 family)
VEFTEYRQYVTGDDLRYLDWHLHARTDRYYIKRFEDETNLLCTLLVDNSRSMAYGSGFCTKAEYAKTLAGTIAYFLTTQRDAIGLFRFSETIDEFIPPRYRSGQLRRILISLDRQPEGAMTAIIPALEQAVERVRKRGLFVLISDFFAPLEELESRLGYLRAAGNEVVIFQILDPAEQEFPFDEAALFVDAETGREIYVDPQQARNQYQQRLEQHLNQLSACGNRLGIQVNRLTTEIPLERALSEFLRARMRVTSRRRRS